VWTPEGKVRNLGTLGGLDSEATLINDRGEIAGWVENSTPDPFSFGDGAETQAFVWKNGSMTPLGTLADGTDSVPFALSESGLLVGCSTTSTSPAPTFNFAPFAPTLWRDGKISNLGNLGGFGGCAASINIRGQIVGYSDLEGDTTQHGFLWDRGNLKDLGTTGGPDSGAFVINDSGDIIGFVDFTEPGPMVHAALWRNGHPVDLKTLLGDSCSQALGMNSRSQVVGSSGPCDFDDGFTQHHATLWSGSALVDLNNAIPPNSGVVLVWAFQMNDRGEISGFATLPNGDPRAFLLSPEDENSGHGDLSTSVTETKAVTPEMIGMRAPTQAGIRRTQASSARASRQLRQARLQRGLGFIRPPVN
jgi:probable HAF family extracellular repeat protein